MRLISCQLVSLQISIFNPSTTVPQWPIFLSLFCRLSYIFRRNRFKLTYPEKAAISSAALPFCFIASSSIAFDLYHENNKVNNFDDTYNGPEFEIIPAKKAVSQVTLETELELIFYYRMTLFLSMSSKIEVSTWTPYKTKT